MKRLTNKNRRTLCECCKKDSEPSDLHGNDPGVVVEEESETGEGVHTVGYLCHLHQRMECLHVL